MFLPLKFMTKLSTAATSTTSRVTPPDSWLIRSVHPPTKKFTPVESQAFVL